MPSDDQPPGDGKSLPQARLAQDFSIVLMRTIESMKSDPSQFRNMIYEMARMRLQKEAFLRDPPMNVLEQRRLMLALETAIERVETESFSRDSLPLLAAAEMDEDLFEPLTSVTNLDEAPTAPLEREAPVPVVNAPAVSEAAAPPRRAAFRAALHERAPPVSVVDAPAASELAPVPRRGALPAALKAMLRLGVLAAIVAAVVFAAKHQFHLDGERLLATIRNVLPQTPSPSRRRAALPQPAEVPSSPDPAAPPTMTAGISAPAAVAPQPAFAPQRDAPPRARSALVPASYGVYAVADGKLFELESLTGRVPDQRVFMSAIITKPSQAILPDGHVTFVVYRRDVMSSAPDRFAVRVIAQVARALVFSKTGQPHTVKVDDAWAIRNVAFDYSVAPSPDSPEMIVIKPEKDGFVLQPGRYGLIVKGLVYDFTIQGKVTQTSHCLERTEAANGTFYSECRSL